MARGGARPNSGPAKGTKYRKRQPKADRLAEKMIKKQQKPKGIKKEPGIESEGEIKLKSGYKTPLQYMLDVMNDNSETDNARRDRMAQAAAPYMHSRRGEKSSKKDDRNKRAKDASKGKFSPSAPPRLKAVKGGK